MRIIPSDPLCEAIRLLPRVGTHPVFCFAPEQSGRLRQYGRTSECAREGLGHRKRVRAVSNLSASEKV